MEKACKKSHKENPKYKDECWEKYDQSFTGILST
jgi:hypothetical protein